jgi:adenylylsulfate kinase-like enzyme
LVDEPFEPPLDPEVMVRSDRQSPKECADVVMERLKSLGYL